MTKRAGELSEEEVERVVTIMNNPRQYKVPDWFLNRQKDVKGGKFSQVLANGLDNKMREDIERLKKIRAHRGLRHYWGLRVRGQHTKTTGRRGRTVGVSKKKAPQHQQQQHHHSRTFGSSSLDSRFVQIFFFLLPVKQQQQQHLMCQHVEYEEYSLCKHASGTTIVVLIK